LLIGATLGAAIYQIFGNKQQAAAPQFAGNNGFASVAAPPAPAAAPQPIVIKVEQPQWPSFPNTSTPTQTEEAPKDATRKARDEMAKHFPVVQKDVDFLGRVSEALENLGFNK
jgi:hypothetical protein